MGPRTAVIVLLYCSGMFVRSNMTDETKYMPMTMARTRTMLFDEALFERDLKT